MSCVRFSPNPQNPVIVSAGWDKLVKVCCALSLSLSEAVVWAGRCFGVERGDEKRRDLSDDATNDYTYLLLQSPADNETTNHQKH